MLKRSGSCWKNKTLNNQGFVIKRKVLEREGKLFNILDLLSHLLNQNLKFDAGGRDVGAD